MRVRNIGLAMIAVALTACAANDPNRRAKTGAAIGAVVGAVVGNQVDKSTKGRVLGAAVGALAGAAVGNYMDKQQQDFERQLEQERQQKALEIERLKDDTLRLNLDSEVSFDFNRAEIKPAFRPTLNKLGEVINKYDRTVVHVVGHTDSVGSSSYNQQLSRQRADSVVAYLARSGVPSDRLRAEGRGESEPRATNSTASGRQLNRRVEIYIKPIVEGQEQRAYQPPRY